MGGIHPQENRGKHKGKGYSCHCIFRGYERCGSCGERSPCGRSGSGDQSFHCGNEKGHCEYNLPLFGIDNVVLEGSHALIKGSRGNYSIHLGSGVIHRQGGHQIQVLPVHSQSRGKLFLPFLDEDPKTAEIMSKDRIIRRRY